MPKKTSFRWRYIRFLGDISLDWKCPKIYRFVPYNRMKEMFDENALTFVSPELWNDPYEKMYFDVKVEGDEIELPDIACLCFRTEQNENSAAFWDKAKIDKESYVRLKFDLYRLCDILDKFASKTKSEIYISSACYRKREYIENAYRNPIIMRNSLKDSYIRLISLKRIAFKYEHELRIFVVWKKENGKIQKYKEGKLLKIKLKDDYSFLKEIMLDASSKSKEAVAADLNLQKNVEYKNYFVSKNSWKVYIKKQVSKCPKIKHLKYPYKKSDLEEEKND